MYVHTSYTQVRFIFRFWSYHEKDAIFQNTWIEEFFPEKIKNINSDDQPWITFKLRKLNRKGKRIFRKERRSENWKKVYKLFNPICHGPLGPDRFSK